MTDPLRAALHEWDAIEGSDLAAQFRAFGAAGKMADAIRAALAADAARPTDPLPVDLSGVTYVEHVADTARPGLADIDTTSLLREIAELQAEVERLRAVRPEWLATIDDAVTVLKGQGRYGICTRLLRLRAALGAKEREQG